MEYKYLASPYTDSDPMVREQRFLAAAACLRHLLACKIWTYSPIVHCHELAKLWGMPHDAAFWQEYDAAMIRGSSGIFVLMLPGWAKSTGVKGEIALTAELGKTITYISGETFDAQVTTGPDKPRTE